jgi:hypothetical protein
MCGSNPGRSNDNTLLVAVSLPSGECRDGSLIQATTILLRIIRIIKLRRMRWPGDVARMGEKRIAYRLLVGKPEGKRPLGRPRRRWVDNIRMDLGELGWSDVDWIGLAQDRNGWRAVVNSVLNLRVP